MNLFQFRPVSERAGGGGGGGAGGVPRAVARGIRRFAPTGPVRAARPGQRFARLGRGPAAAAFRRRGGAI